MDEKYYLDFGGVKMWNLKNLVAIVTGGGAGIGREITEHLLESGASVVVVDLDCEEAKNLEKDQNKKVRFYEQDLYRIEEFDRIIDFTVKTFSHINILVNCAGIYPSQPALDISEDKWDSVLDLNLKVPFFMSQKFAAYKIAHQETEGSIVNICSTASKVPRPGIAHYASSKAGLAMLTQVLALEWAPYHIRVNGVCPGVIETETLLSTLDNTEAKKEHVEKLSNIPMGKAGPADEIAKCVMYLADEQSSSYMTGQTIYIDGGYTAGKTFSSFKQNQQKDN